MKSSIIFMSSIVLTAQCMENQKYSYQGAFYQMAAKAPCFLTYEKERKPIGDKSELVTVNWYRHTMHLSDNNCDTVLCFSTQYLSSKEDKKNIKNHCLHKKSKSDQTLSQLKTMALTSALSASGRYAARQRQKDLHIIDIANKQEIVVENYDGSSSVMGFCGDNYLVQDGFKVSTNKEEGGKHFISIWSIEGKQRSVIFGLQFAGSYISALGYCMLHQQNQFIAWQPRDQKDQYKQQNFLINCDDGKILKAWKSSFEDIAIHEKSLTIAGDCDNRLHICSLEKMDKKGLPKKLRGIRFPAKDIIRCWCFNDQGNLLIIGTDQGKVIIHDWMKKQKTSINFNEDNPSGDNSINSVWFPCTGVCCADIGVASFISIFNPEKILENVINPLSNNNNNEDAILTTANPSITSLTSSSNNNNVPEDIDWNNAK